MVKFRKSSRHALEGETVIMHCVCKYPYYLLPSSNIAVTAASRIKAKTIPCSYIRGVTAGFDSTGRLSVNVF